MKAAATLCFAVVAAWFSLLGLAFSPGKGIVCPYLKPVPDHPHTLACAKKP